MNILEDAIDDINLHQPTAIWRGMGPWVVHCWNHFPPREGFAQCQAMAQLETYCNRDLWDFIRMMMMMMIIEADPTEHFLAIPWSWVQKRARSNLVSLMDFP